MTVAATLSLADAARERWGALVVGAGPAGSLTARELARLGVRVLLVDRSAFPRRKFAAAAAAAGWHPFTSRSRRLAAASGCNSS